jgi:hypothetical protein
MFSVSCFCFVFSDCFSACFSIQQALDEGLAIAKGVAIDKVKHPKVNIS